jgi:modulator of FtsH protease
LACLIGTQFAVRTSQQLTVVLLGGFGVLMRLALAPRYWPATPVWTRRDSGRLPAPRPCSSPASGRPVTPPGVISRRSPERASWALPALIAFGVVLIFVNIPGGALIYSVLGLLIFAGLTMYDFQRIRQSRDVSSAPLAASIFLDILNVFTFFLPFFSREE